MNIPPYCNCDKHGRQKGYLYCTLLREDIIANDKPEAKVQLPPNMDKQILGILLCCGAKHEVSQLRLICELCALEVGLLHIDVAVERVARIAKESVSQLDSWYRP
jgi:hypothetical protein